MIIGHVPTVIPRHLKSGTIEAHVCYIKSEMSQEIFMYIHYYDYKLSEHL